MENKALKSKIKELESMVEKSRNKTSFDHEQDISLERFRQELEAERNE